MRASGTNPVIRRKGVKSGYRFATTVSPDPGSTQAVTPKSCCTVAHPIAALSTSVNVALHAASLGVAPLLLLLLLLL